MAYEKRVIRTTPKSKAERRAAEKALEADTIAKAKAAKLEKLRQSSEAKKDERDATTRGARPGQSRPDSFTKPE